MSKTLLSITIPTFNRSQFLKVCLNELHQQLKDEHSELVEIVVSDNCSPDATHDVVKGFVANGLAINYKRNEENIGWGANFLQCFNLASGKYVLMLSDDDILCEGAIAEILLILTSRNIGVLCLNAYGYTNDFKAERPNSSADNIDYYTDFNVFFEVAMPRITLLSASVFNKEVLKDLDTSVLVPGNFAHLHLVLRSASIAGLNAIMHRFFLASKRDNSANYDYAALFVEELWELVDNYRMLGISQKSIDKVKSGMLIDYYPTDLLRLRLWNESQRLGALLRFNKRFGDFAAYRVLIVPIMRLPRFLAIPWAITIVLIGKIYSGNFRIVAKFFSQRILNLSNWLWRFLSRNVFGH